MVRAGRQAGFTYVALLIGVAVLGVGLAATGQVWRTAATREKERELLFVGNEYRKAIMSYYAGTRAGVVRFPRNLQDLVEDNRTRTLQRHLRRLYPDPITGEEKWGIVPSPDGGIAGVFSLSDERPLKVAGFVTDKKFEDAERYSDWKFVYTPPAAIGKPPIPATNPRGG